MKSKFCVFRLKIWLPWISLILNFKDIYQCEDNDRVYAIIKAGLSATHVVHTGDLVPAGTMLVTPGLHLICY